MAVRKLSVDIISALKGDGFKKTDESIDGINKKVGLMSSGGAKAITGLIGGYFALSKAQEAWTKSIEGSNYQLEQELKLTSTLEGQGFSKQSIQNVKDYASELQTLGIIGDEVTLAGTQQLATYNLTENQLKQLMPAMQDVAIQMKGFNVEGGDMVGVANMLAKGIMGQTGALRKAGITLNEYQEGLIKTGTQQEKVNAIIEAVTMNVGKQNEAFLNTPEGKIRQVQNDIGDTWESAGFQLQRLRLGWYEFIGETGTGVDGFVKDIASSVADTGLSIIGLAQDVGGWWESLDDETKTYFKLAAGYITALTVPFAAVGLVIQDVIGWTQGYKSVTGEVVDYITEKWNKPLEILEDIKDLTVDITSKLGLGEFWDDHKKAAFELGNIIGGIFEGDSGAVYPGFNNPNDLTNPNPAPNNNGLGPRIDISMPVTINGNADNNTISQMENMIKRVMYGEIRSAKINSGGAF